MHTLKHSSLRIKTFSEFKQAIFKSWVNSDSDKFHKIAEHTEALKAFKNQSIKSSTENCDNLKELNICTSLYDNNLDLSALKEHFKTPKYFDFTFEICSKANNVANPQIPDLSTLKEFIHEAHIASHALAKSIQHIENDYLPYV